MNSMPPEFSFATAVIHAGVHPDPATGAVMTPIYQTSTYAQSAPGEHLGYEYSRTDNPTRTVLQSQLAELERGTNALVFSSGLAAIDAVINLLSHGDHVIASHDLYGGSYRLFTKVASNRGISFTFLDPREEGALEAAFTSATKLVWLESPTNPMMNLADIGSISSQAKARGALVAVDNTFMSPYNQLPLTLGADIVMHSMTKYINGHSDVVMGCLAIRDRQFGSAQTGLYERLKFLQNAVGATPGPFDCFLVLRGIKTLDVRMERHGRSAGVIAEFLANHPKVEAVHYPGLASHREHELARRQMSGFGGMMSCALRTDLSGTIRFLTALRYFTLAESLGGVESLVEHPAIMTHASIPAGIRHGLGISDSLVRLSIGIEGLDDLISDLNQALDAV